MMKHDENHDEMMIEASRQDDPSNKTLDLNNFKWKLTNKKIGFYHTK